MDNKKSHKTGTIIRFNGAKYNLDEWTAREEAAEKERQLDWQHAFSDHGEEKRSTERIDPSLPDRRKKAQPTMGKLKQTAGRNAGFTGAVRRFKRYWLPGAAALVVGLAIGLSLLSVFSGTNSVAGSVWPRSPAASPVSAGSIAIQAGSLSQTFTVIQTGVFSTRKLADVAVTGLKQQGFAAVAAGEKPVSVLIGTSVSAQSADDLLNKYRSRHLPVYKKQIRIGPKSGKKLLKGPSAAYAEKANLLLKDLYQASDRLASGNRNAQQNLFSQVQGSRAALRQINVSGLKTADLNRLTLFDQDADHAVRILESTLKNGRETDFTALQQSLLELIAAYQDLVLHL
ncbi:hypothetical protein [Sporolactobacillus vineae]|uniref:hypothetical protein n=1 Tax=Sporolactobacillus vineae TaxID=444463 RepID=UPI0002885899|nr:hypothetical protein [Sporolactobacillus vineae]